MTAHTLMIQGTTSDAGKSTLATAVCRILARRGIAVAPMKPQNMALNSAVTADGGEIGRSQAVQAMAAGIEPLTDMNPVLLKPNSDTGSQVIVQGHSVGNMDAWAFHRYKRVARDAVLESHRRLAEAFDFIVVEGAGSPAEINLRRDDIANMGFAEAIQCPVWLVADIDRGGVFAHLVGTLELLSESERALVEGLIINRFRGDKAILQPGLDWLERRTGKPVLGVLPLLGGLHLEAEDSLSRGTTTDRPDAKLRVTVPAFPRASNHTDLDPLRLHPQIALRWVEAGESLSPSDLVILPGSKSVRPDLDMLRRNGWDAEILRHLRYGGKIIGICGGFQMLGRVIHDPRGCEGIAGSSAGLSVLDIETTIEPEKVLTRVDGHLRLSRARVTGYEIHMGRTVGQGLERPLIDLERGPDGAISPDGQVIGTYLHGLFDHPEAQEALLRWAGLAFQDVPDYRSLRDAEIDRLADHVESHLDLSMLPERGSRKRPV